ncbi:hypothetical protein GWR56_03365 [Mucilaginibacter sp. 14171R-50]|uniref:hypothetical protein n=1 Tax=Mucilaginibacter sp. 14171R-50 TaxID=2703789 RepID=UPI00138BF18A|nr:hypothetical protein [Mucilaginibacter sp. 14171R-50]QHS54629.1 hypothetical protein GWR56_03365 [Mucilaginibacter sp. 14171R-50]
MKTFCLFIVFFAAGISGFAQTKAIDRSKANSLLVLLKSKRAAVDAYVKKHDKKLLLYSKIPGEKIPVRVKNGKWPDEVEYSYNLLKDSLGKIVMIAEIPFSQSGDWYITYTHYFDEDGNTYAFKKETNTFDSEVKDGVIYETLIRYYGASLKLLNKTYSLKDKGGKPIKNNGHIDVYQYKYNIYKNAAECLKAYNIKML